MSRPIALPLSHAEAAHLIAALRLLCRDKLDARSSGILKTVSDRAYDLLKEQEKTKGL